MKTLLASFLLFALLGCQSSEKKVSSGYHSTVWQANIVANVLYPDFREDGKIDYQWADEVPVTMREKLEKRAKELSDQK